MSDLDRLLDATGTVPMGAGDANLKSSSKTTMMSGATQPDRDTGGSLAPASASLLRRLTDAAVRFKDQPAVSAGPSTATYGEFVARVADIAAGLREAGVRPGDHIGLCMARGVDQVASLFAAWACGGAYVSIDPKLPAQRIESMCEQAEIRLVITDDTAPEARWPARFAIESVGPAAEARGVETLGDMADSLYAKLGPAADRLLAYVIFTSGSTGRPKGVAVDHANLRYFTDTFDEVIGRPGPDAVWIAGAQLSFDVSVPEVIGALTTGSHVVVRNRLEPIAPLIRRHGGTHLQCVPSQLALFAAEESEREGLSQLEFLLTVGEILPVALAADIRRLMAPGARFVNAYGPTEITVYASAEDIVEPPKGPISIGRPFKGTSFAVVDQNRKRVPPGTMGELVIASPGVTRGYIGRPDLTAQAFVDMAIDGTGVPVRAYLTGDLVSVQPDGRYHIHGRRDHQVKIRGNRVELGEIEQVLLTNSSVLLAAVLTVDAGGGDVRLVAHVSPKEGASIDTAALKASCVAALPAYMVPAVIVVHDALPRTSSGKVDRTVLKALPAPWANEGKAPESANDDPTDRLAAMQRLWSRLLGSPVGPDDNFFDMGGHSLLGVELLLAAERDFGRRLPLGTLVEATTPRQLLAAMDAESEPSRSVVVMRQGARPAVVVIHGAGGYLLKLNPLAQRLAPGHKIVGISAHGLDGRHEPDGDVETMVRRYLADLAIEHVEVGVLVGYSGGGLVAAAMADEMAKRGMKRPPVVLLDSDIPTGRVPTRLRYWRNLLLNFATGGLPAVKAWAAVRRERRQELESRARIRAEIAGEGFVDILGHLTAVMAKSVVPRSDNEYVLIKALQMNPSERPDFGWQRYTSVPVEVRWAPGNHLTMLELPHAEELARIVNSVIESRIGSCDEPACGTQRMGAEPV